jgi:hypothetical protein
LIRYCHRQVPRPDRARLLGLVVTTLTAGRSRVAEDRFGGKCQPTLRLELMSQVRAAPDHVDEWILFTPTAGFRSLEDLRFVPHTLFPHDEKQLQRNVFRIFVRGPDHNSGKATRGSSVSQPSDPSVDRERLILAIACRHD